ncbi:SDR family oxidoreductase [Streptomyces malaysiensis]|uniref:hypothetical protein n=1 Tax=Streptomyces malaysiensis TaxID=92644 RepID=UPI002B28BD2F|nr:hypothetical protein R8789_11915 [Streptomyces malaysiensis]
MGVGVSVAVLALGAVATDIAESGRSRPGRFGGPTSGTSRSGVAALISGGMDPRLVGEHAVHAIEHDRFFVFTHPELSGLVIERHGTIMMGLEESAAYVTRYQAHEVDGDSIHPDHRSSSARG